VKKQERGTKIRIVGSKPEILGNLARLTAQGFVWRSNKHFYPRIGESGFYSCYLENFEWVGKAEAEAKTSASSV
jgi:hypothetical protein